MTPWKKSNRKQSHSVSYKHHHTQGWNWDAASNNTAHHQCFLFCVLILWIPTSSKCKREENTVPYPTKHHLSPQQGCNTMLLTFSSCCQQYCHHLWNPKKWQKIWHSHTMGNPVGIPGDLHAFLPQNQWQHQYLCCFPPQKTAHSAVKREMKVEEQHLKCSVEEGKWRLHPIQACQGDFPIEVKFSSLTRFWTQYYCYWDPSQWQQTWDLVAARDWVKGDCLL